MDNSRYGVDSRRTLKGFVTGELAFIPQYPHWVSFPVKLNICEHIVQSFACTLAAQNTMQEE